MNAAIKSLRQAAPCMLILLTATCDRVRVQTLPARYGITEAVTGRQIAEQAVLFANLVLPDNGSTRLNFTWQPSGYFPTLAFAKSGRGFSRQFITNSGFDNGLVFNNADVVPVFLVDGTMLGNVEGVFVPQALR